MYAVIFRAKIARLDEQYAGMAERMRALASDKYGCLGFSSVDDGKHEIAISYWASMEDIAAWKNDPEHKQAQRLGRERWYSDYQVEITEIVRSRKSG